MTRNPRLWAAGAGIVTVVALSVLVFQLVRDSRGAQPPSTKAFYTIDDGKTLFVDDVSKTAPFDHEGKPAYRAHVWRCPDGSTMVSHLSRDANRSFQPTGKAASGTRDFNEVAMERARVASLEVRDPNTPDSEWFPLNSPRGIEITRPTCPDGSPAIEPMDPN
jgi:hypothetical protein